MTFICKLGCIEIYKITTPERLKFGLLPYVGIESGLLNISNFRNTKIEFNTLYEKDAITIAELFNDMKLTKLFT